VEVFAALRKFYGKRSRIEVGKILKNLAKFQLRRICVSTNRCCMNPGLIKKVKKF
jgi:hypothetical protein